MYCNHIINGESLIISMRSDPQKPLYTIEVHLSRDKLPIIYQMHGKQNCSPTLEEREVAEAFVREKIVMLTA